MSSSARAESGANAAGGFVYGLLLFNGTLIAGMYAFAKVAGEHGISPLGLLAWQLLFAAIVIGVVTAARGELPVLTFPGLRYAAIAGVLGITAPNLITFAALRHVPAGLVGVITALSPALTYAIATLMSAERFEPLRAAGVLLGLAGVMAILLPRGALPDPEALPWAVAAVIAPLLLAGGNVFRSLAWPSGLRPLAAATLLLAIQALVLVPVAAVLGEFEVPRSLTGAKDLPLLGAGVLTAAFYLGAFELQKRGGAIVVGQIGYVITVSSLLLGALVFGERYPLTTFLAVLVVLAGVMLANRRAGPDAVHPAVPAVRSHNGCTA